MRKKFQGAFLVIIFATLLLALTNGVRAMGVMQAVIEPAHSSLAAGNQIVIRVEVKNGDNLNGYNLKINYNPEVITLETWSHGGYMSNLKVDKQVNDPGSLSLEVMQFNTPGVSGDGTLLNLTFTGKTSGVSAVQISEVAFIRSSGESVFPDLSSGEVNVTTSSLPSPAFTATPTAILTLTPTVTPILTSTESPLRTWTPTRTRTPTAAVGATITPIRAIVATRTGTVVTPMDVVLPGNENSGSQPGIEAGYSPTAPPSYTWLTDSEIVAPRYEVVEGGEGSLSLTAFTIDSQEGLTAPFESNRSVNRTNGLLWSVGALFIVGLTGLVIMFANLWRKL